MELKDSVNSRLLALYHDKGLQTTLAVAEKLLTKNKRTASADFKTSLNGELCETVLEVLVIDYCKQHVKETREWCFGKGLILKDPEKSKVESDFLTELDFTLFTPQCVYLFECKSYAGEKILTGAGTIRRSNGAVFDVYNQSMIHVETLDKWLGRVSRNPEYKIILFDFSRGEMQDMRSAKAKRVFPCVNAKNWETVLVTGASVWDMQFIAKFVRTLQKSSKKLRREHLAYVRSLHGREDT